MAMLDSYIVKFVLVVTIATMLTRCIAIFFPKKYMDNKIIRSFNAAFPAMILTLLIIYAIKDANFNIQDMFSMQFAYREIIGIIIVVLVHIITKRNALLSMFAGTGTYILLGYV